jgi:hypothetical protein
MKSWKFFISVGAMPCFFCQSARFSMCRSCSGLLISSRASMPPKPLALVANAWLCHALKFSYWTQDGQPVVYAHFSPATLSFAAAAITAGHVFGGCAGSSPAFLNASLLK